MCFMFLWCLQWLEEVGSMNKNSQQGKADKGRSFTPTGIQTLSKQKWMRKMSQHVHCLNDSRSLQYTNGKTPQWAKTERKWKFTIFQFIYLCTVLQFFVFTDWIHDVLCNQSLQVEDACRSGLLQFQRLHAWIILHALNRGLLLWAAYYSLCLQTLNTPIICPHCNWGKNVIKMYTWILTVFCPSLSIRDVLCKLQLEASRPIEEKHAEVA